MRAASLALIMTLIVPATASATCFRDCLGSKIASESSDQQITDAAKQCRESCETQARDGLAQAGKLDQVTTCKAEPLSKDELKKLRAATPSHYVQSNIFIWDFRNPFPDKALFKIEVGAQNMDLNEMSFTGTGLVPPSGEGAFVIPGFFDGYPAVRFAAKVVKVWACPVN
ncbi:MAG: hypothetical protein DI565_08140 [Ancylobacter novellus]|uniref:Uncharacterized protein n=1 Tax=Ancylobacter novellus TaxID=921 RepID=A0A2W5KFY7_ANCNO|nr:MAG: hypothetical protein DI565_08140 [Ancylobacter novellus]